MSLQSKRHLVGEVVRVLGVEKTLELFERTVVTQETGGVMTASGDKKSVGHSLHVTAHLVYNYSNIGQLDYL